MGQNSSPERTPAAGTKLCVEPRDQRLRRRAVRIGVGICRELSPVVSGSPRVDLGVRSILRGWAAFAVTGIVFVDVQKRFEVGSSGALIRGDIPRSGFIVAPMAVSQDLVGLLSLGHAALLELFLAGLVRPRGRCPRGYRIPVEFAGALVVRPR